MSLIVCLIIALVVAAAVLGVVRAVLALPPMANLAPYGGVIYALILLLIVLAVIDFCFDYSLLSAH
jgi:hypothetical protein